MSTLLTLIWTQTAYVCHSDIKQTGSVAYCYHVQRYGTKVGLIKVQIHVLSRIVATDCRNYGITCLAADDKSIIVANTWTRPIQVEFKKVQPYLANIRLCPDDTHRAGSWIRERGRRAWVSEVGPIISDCFSTSCLDCWAARRLNFSICLDLLAHSFVIIDQIISQSKK